jgi:hypothetical protein
MEDQQPIAFKFRISISGEQQTVMTRRDGSPLLRFTEADAVQTQGCQTYIIVTHGGLSSETSMESTEHRTNAQEQRCQQFPSHLQRALAFISASAVAQTPCRDRNTALQGLAANPCTDSSAQQNARWTLTLKMSIVKICRFEASMH